MIPSNKLTEIKKIGLVAHDSKKEDMINWCKKHLTMLKNHKLFATGTTGRLLEKDCGLKIKKFISGPLGGDQQIGSSIVEKKINMLIFFWDPLEPMPHDPDIKALLRVATMWNIPVACNKTTADFLIKSPLMKKSYKPW